MSKIEFSGNLLGPLPVILVGANVGNKPKITGLSNILWLCAYFFFTVITSYKP